MNRVKHYVGCLLLMVAALSLASCHLDELRGDDLGAGQENGEVGYLQLKSLMLNVNNEGVDLNTDANASTRADEENQESTNRLYDVPNPNNIVENVDNYWIEVYDEIAGTLVDINGDAEGVGCYFKDFPTDGVALEPGGYTVYAYKTKDKGSDIEAMIADVSGQQPAEGKVLAYYMGSARATITSGQPTSVEVVCKLANVITTVELSADLIRWFKRDANGATMLSTQVAIAAANEAEAPADAKTNPEKYRYTFPYTSNHGVVDNDGKVIGGGPFVYFKDLAGPLSTSGNKLVLDMSGTFYTGLEFELDNNRIDESKWAEVSMHREITDVKAAQWRRISIDIDRNNEGNVQFVVKIESYVYDKTIDVDVVTLYSSLNIEEEVPDVGVENPDAPSISIKNVVADENGALNYAINGSMYDADAEGWNSYLKVNVVPQAGSTVKEVYATFASDNASFLSAMISKGFADYRMNIYSDVAAVAEGGNVSDYLSVKDVTDGAAGEKLITVKAAGMSALYKYAGTHTVSVYTVDSENRKKHTDIVITVTKGSGSGTPPTIVWMKDGENVIDKTHTIDANNAATFKCVIDMTSVTGFTALTVDISSEVLTKDVLVGVGLNDKLDLITIPESQIPVLQELGFLDKENNETTLAGKTEKTFNISAFMALLRTLYISNDAHSGYCYFKITVGDANGVTTKTLTFYIDVSTPAEDN